MLCFCRVREDSSGQKDYVIMLDLHGCLAFRAGLGNRPSSCRHRASALRQSVKHQRCTIPPTNHSHIFVAALAEPAARALSIQYTLTVGLI